MTVAQLIEELKKLPQDQEVVVAEESGCSTFEVLNITDWGDGETIFEFRMSE